jgi:hypothetical protein
MTPSLYIGSVLVCMRFVYKDSGRVFTFAVFSFISTIPSRGLYTIESLDYNDSLNGPTLSHCNRQS